MMVALCSLPMAMPPGLVSRQVLPPVMPPLRPRLAWQAQRLGWPALASYMPQ
jgi:hypothetical protein